MLCCVQHEVNGPETVYLGHKEAVVSLLCSQGFLVSGSRDQSVKHWDHQGNCLCTFGVDDDSQHTGPVLALCEDDIG